MRFFVPGPRGILISPRSIRTNVGELSSYGTGPFAQDGWKVATLPNDSDHCDDVGIQWLVDEIVFPYRVDVAISHAALGVQIALPKHAHR